jgi:hypothetical protein
LNGVGPQGVGVGLGDRDSRHLISLILACWCMYVCERMYFKTNNKWKENNYKEPEGGFG